MELISYWKKHDTIHTERDLTLIIGWYNHKNQESADSKALGIHWSDDYPQSRGKLSPCVIPKNTRDAMLAGLLHQAMLNSDLAQIDSITKAIAFFKNEEHDTNLSST